MENGHPVTTTELHAALTTLKDDLRGDFRSEIKTATDELRNEIQAVKDELTELVRQVETNLLTEFHRYAKGQQVRMHSLENGNSD